MVRRRLLLIVMVVLAATLQGIRAALSDPFAGTWQLNLEKSKYNPGPPPRSGSVNVQGDGQNRKATTAGIDAAGNPFTQTYMFIFDSQPHPVMGNRLGDAATYTPVDDNTVSWTMTKGGQVVQTGTDTISRDGRTFTITSTRLDTNGQPINNIAVFDKQ